MQNINILDYSVEDQRSYKKTDKTFLRISSKDIEVREQMLIIFLKFAWNDIECKSLLSMQKSLFCWGFPSIKPYLFVSPFARVMAFMFFFWSEEENELGLSL